jgi:nucleoside-diphosphate-sugar epimerase
MQVLMAGSSGLVNRRLCPALEQARHAVRVVREDSSRRLTPFESIDYDDPVLQALGVRAKAARTSWGAPCRTGVGVNSDWWQRCRPR